MLIIAPSAEAGAAFAHDANVAAATNAAHDADDDGNDDGGNDDYDDDAATNADCGLHESY